MILTCVVGLSLGCESAVEPADAEIHANDATTPDARVDGFVPPVCETTAPTSCVSPAPTYADIAPVIEARCLGCHFGLPGGPWPLTSYDHVSDWRDTIRSAMLDCSMPPPEEQIPMTTAERMLMLDWIRCGLLP